MGQGRGIENRIERIQGDDKPLYAILRMGGLFDNRAGATFGGGGYGEDDTALAARVGLGYQFTLKEPLGFRIDYDGYTDFHNKFSKFNIQEHHFSAEIQYAADPFTYSLPLGFTHTREDGRPNTDRKSVTPTVTYLMRSGTKAIGFYGLAAQIEDRDANTVLDENGTSLGMGCSYFHFFKELSRTRFSIDYMNTEYDALVKDYGSDSASQKNREDRILTTSIDIRYFFTPITAVYTTYSFIHSKSNVETFDYNRHILEFGIAIRY